MSDVIANQQNRAGVPASEFSTSGADIPAPTHGDIIKEEVIYRRNYTPAKLVDKIEKGHRVCLRRSFRSMTAQFLGIGAALIIAVTAAIMMPEYAGGCLLIAACVCLTFIITMLHKRLDMGLEVSWLEVRAVSGKWSPTQKTLTVASKQLRSTQVQQTHWQKLLGIGDLTMADLIPNQPDIAIMDVYQPYFHAEVMREISRRQQ